MSEEQGPSGRRSFLKQCAGAVAGASALLAGDARKGADHKDISSQQQTAALPPHRRIDLGGVHAYAEKSVAAGETIHFRTSSTVPYQLSVVRLAGDVDDLESDVVLHTFKESAPTPQAIHPGSYVHVQKRLSAEKEIKAITLECWVRPWSLKRRQGLISQHDDPKAGGIGLFIHDQGRASVYFGDGGAHNKLRMFVGTKLNHRRWNHVAGTWDGKQATLWINGRKTGIWELAGPVKAADAPLRLAASGEKSVADHFLDGDLAMPPIYSRALTAEEIKERIDSRGLKTPPLEHVIACWLLAEENGESIADIGTSKRSGTIINHGAWMIGGPSFNGGTVGRYDEAYAPVKDEQRGHALRFASDDLYDCHWQSTHEFKIPVDAKSGLYAGRYEYELGGQQYQYHVTFNVRRAASRPKPQILVLLSTSTWLAYNAAPFPTAVRGLHAVDTDGLRSCHAQAPAYSCYRDHHHQQPAYYLGMNVPWPVAGPDVLYLSPHYRYSHLMRGELFLHRWLDGHYGDHEGYDYDVVTDYDLHRDPEMLNGYKTLFINGHSEYWSAEAYTAVDQFLTRGGTTVALSGNTMFWRTSFSEDGSVMECRKFDPRIGGRGGATIGELYHSHDKLRGSLMREAGYPAWKCIGLDCCGWAGSVDGAYHTELPEHFLFTQPENTELVKTETFGHARREKYPMAIGHEWDVRLSTLKKMTRNVPAGAKLPDEPEGITTLARGIRRGGGTIDYFTARAAAIDAVCAEMIYWERPRGGRVFHAGSIAAGWALSADPKWQTVMRNVLHHLGVKSKRG
jgi:N,N-dimethylformamidase